MKNEISATLLGIHPVKISQKDADLAQLDGTCVFCLKQLSVGNMLLLKDQPACSCLAAQVHPTLQCIKTIVYIH